MSLVILHLSDIHTTPEIAGGVLTERMKRVPSLLNEFLPQVEGIVVAVTGDIASTGTQAEYWSAVELLQELKEQLHSVCHGRLVHVICIPGNHDCNFQRDSSPRKVMLEHLLSHPDSKVDTESIAICTAVQEEYFEFQDTISDGTGNLGPRILHTHKDIVLGRRRVRFHLFNTAWMSRLREKPGELLFPDTDEGPPESGGDLEVSLLHHPYNWLQPNHGRTLRKYVSKRSHLVLTGHEHEPAQELRITAEGGAQEYVEGGVFYDPDNVGSSSANVIELNLDNQHWVSVTFFWDGENFREKMRWNPPSPTSFAVVERHRSIALSPDWDKYLKEPDAQYTHPIKGLLNLDDIYIPQQLTRVLIGEVATETGATMGRIDGSTLADEIAMGGRFAVLGPPYSGKTTLAKMAYRLCLQAGRYPVLLRGSEVRAGSREQQLRRLESAYSKQYSSDTLDLYRQLDREKRAVIIDDFDYTRMNAKGRHELLAWLDDSCSATLVLAEQPLFFEQLTEGSPDPGLLTAFKYCMLMEMGHLLRERLIRKWVSLGQETTITSQELAYQSEKAGRVISVLVRKNLMPVYPFFVLAILQTMESNVAFKEEMGTYGYFYEYLIHDRMLKSSLKATPETKYAVLADLAFKLHTEQRAALPESEVEEFGHAFRDEHLAAVRVDRLIEDMTDRAELLTQTDEGYAFRYPYIRYYFVARYMRDRLGDPVQGPAIRELVRKMCAEIYREEYTHVVMFLSYLSRDPIVKEELLRNAELVYARCPWCTLTDETHFLEAGGGTLPPPALTAKTVEQSRDDHMMSLDETQDDPAVLEEAEANGRIPKEVLDANKATKTLDALGQIARNLSGSLPAAEKVRIITACCGIGLRAMAFYLESARVGHDALVGVFEQSIREAIWRTAEMRKARGDHRPPRELPADILKEKASQLLYAYAAWLCHIIIKRISRSAGCEELELVYDRVLQEHKTPAVELIDLSVRLEHLPRVNPADIVAGYEGHEKLPFVQHLYRLAVAERLELFYEEEPVKQQLCTKLGIPYLKARYLSSDRKRFTG